MDDRNMPHSAAALAQLARRFVFNTATIRIIVEPFRAEDWDVRPRDGAGNDAHWLLGHIVTTRHQILRRIGVDEPKAEWEALFGAGAKPDGHAGYPSTDALMAALDATSTRIGDALPMLSDDKCAEPFGAAFPDGGESVLDGLSFLEFHETYHVGQLGLLRRIAGHAGFV